MKHQKHLGILITTLILSTMAFAKGDAKKGKILFDKSQCNKCHGTEVYTRENRKIKSLKALEKQVRYCDSQLSVNWFDEDISDVVAYLNDAFYKFDTNKKNTKKEDSRNHETH